MWTCPHVFGCALIVGMGWQEHRQPCQSTFGIVSLDFNTVEHSCARRHLKQKQTVECMYPRHRARRPRRLLLRAHKQSHTCETTQVIDEKRLECHHKYFARTCISIRMQQKKPRWYIEYARTSLIHWICACTHGAQSHKNSITAVRSKKKGWEEEGGRKEEVRGK